jgi:PKD repeat protein
VNLTGSGSDPDGDPLTYAWDLNNDGVFETAGQTVTFSAVGLDGPGSRTVVLKVADNKGASATANVTVNITNVAPTVGAIVASVNPVQVNTAVNASANFSDPGVLDTHTAVWRWGDGSSSTGTVSEANGSGTVAGSHTYATPGVYTVTLTVTDKDGGNGTASATVYVYQPTQFVIWGGNQPSLSDAVKIGQSYMFWGAQWAKQVTAGDYQANNSFKGWANGVTVSTWTTSPGNSSNPPASIGNYISIIVTTHVTKNGNVITGNIAEVVVLRVDNPGTYQPDPGHSASGTVVAVVR